MGLSAIIKSKAKFESATIRLAENGFGVIIGYDSLFRDTSKSYIARDYDECLQIIKAAPSEVDVEIADRSDDF